MSKQISFLALMIAGCAGAAPVAGLAQATAPAAAGTLDPTFGNGGKVLAAPSITGPVNVKLQADAKIVVVAAIDGTKSHAARLSFGVLRFLENGQPDAGFGAGGVVRDAVFSRYVNAPRDLLIQPDGKILVVGGASELNGSIDPVALARFNRDGSLDATFGAGGNVAIGGHDFKAQSASVVLLQPDGKIVIGGTSQMQTEHPPPPQAILMRFSPDGSLDASFGKGGKVRSLPSGNITALALQTDGKILTNVGTPFVRVLANGAIDPGHAAGKIAATAHTGPGAFQPDGRFVLTGSAPGETDGDIDVRTARFKEGGGVDRSFASPVFDYGKEALCCGEDTGAAITFQEGKVIVGGVAPYHVHVSTICCDYTQFGVARLGADGALDQGFGASGRVTTPFSPKVTNGTKATGLAVQPDGKIVAVGLALTLVAQPEFPDTGRIALTRYLP